MHPNEYLSRELLETKGGGFGLEGLSRLKNGDIESNPVGYTNKDFVHSFGAIILKQIAKKAQIEYPENTTLIIQCTLNTIYMQDEWKLLVELVTANLPPTRFREIYLYDNAGQQSHSIFSQQASKA